VHTPYFVIEAGSNTNQKYSEKELRHLFSANQHTSSKKHHRKISSINPVITEATKYRDEYDLSQEDLIENYVFWKKHFDFDTKEVKLMMESPKSKKRF